MLHTGILKDIRNSLERRKLGELLVAKGVITPVDLKIALSVQKHTRKPLGEIFLERRYVTRSQLTHVLCKQAVLRACATLMLGAISMGGVCAAKKAHAEDMNGGGRLILASTTQEFSRVASYPALVGMSEKRSTNLSPFTKWTGMFARFEQQINSGSATSAVRDMESKLQAFRGGSIKQMAENVNDMMNARPYILDKNNWGRSDYWATPAEFMQRGGDCEDYAIAKYAALRTLGVPEDRLRIAIVQDTKKNIPHAVLVVYAENGAYLLDNQNDHMLNAETYSRYRPIYSINRQAWWLHSAPGSTMVASAE